MTQTLVPPYSAPYLPQPQRTEKKSQYSAGAVGLYIKEHFQPTSCGSVWIVIDVNTAFSEGYILGMESRFESPGESAREQLEFIETAFDLKISQLADLFGVTRQSIYDWKKGKSISDDNRRRLDGLYKAAQRFKGADLRPDYAIKHRTIGGDLEFIQALAGQNPVKAVEKLIEVLERGRKQRERLEKLLKDRPRPEGSIADDLPPHYPGE